MPIKTTIGHIRVALALMVINLHYKIYENAFNSIIFPRISELKINLYFCGDGNIAVAGFFIISGYLVSEIFDKKYKTENYIDFLHFTTSRYARIFPLYLIVLFTYTAIQFFIHHLIDKSFATPSLKNIILNATLLPYGIYDYFNINSPLFTHNIIGPAWTLCLDLVFYPLGFILLKEKKFLWATFLMLATFYAGFYIFKSDDLGTNNCNPWGNWWHHSFYTLIEPNMLCFVSGMLANIYLKNKKIPKYIWYLSMISLFYVCYFPALPHYIGYFGAYAIGILSLMAIIGFAGNNGRSKYENELSNFTYSIYLVHIPTITLLSFFAHRFTIPSLCISIMLAYVISKYLEGRVIERKRRALLESWSRGKTNAATDFTRYNYATTLILGLSIAFYSYHFLIQG